MLARRWRRSARRGAPPPPIDAGAPIEHLREFAAEAGRFGAAFAALITLPLQRSVSASTEIDPRRGRQSDHVVHSPAGAKGPMPALHLHGGGMVISAAADAQYVRWRDELAAAAWW
jgi:hypothetical protein